MRRFWATRKSNSCGNSAEVLAEDTVSEIVGNAFIKVENSESLKAYMALAPKLDKMACRMTDSVDFMIITSQLEGSIFRSWRMARRIPMTICWCTERHPKLSMMCVKKCVSVKLESIGRQGGRE